jgi:hypothetical protein
MNETHGTIHKHEPVIVFQATEQLIRPGWRRVGVLLAVTGFVALGMFISAIAAIIHAVDDAFWPLVRLFLSATVVAYVAVYARRLWLEGRHLFRLEFWNDGVALDIVDEGRELPSTMTYNEMKFVEFFAPPERPVLIFHSHDDRIIEVPLWRIKEDPLPAVNLLRDKGVVVVTSYA